MTTLADEDEFVRVLYWGNFGTGKTTDMAYLARSGPVKWIRTDKGLKPGPLRRMGVPVENIKPCDELRPDMLLKTVDEWAGELNDKPGSIAGVVLDTATDMIQRRLEDQADSAWKAYVQKCRKQHTEPDRSLRYSAVDDTREWYGTITQEMSRLVRRMTDLPWHVAISAQIRRDVDKDTGHVQYGPAANPAVGGLLVGYCDLVIETQADGQYEDGADCFIGHPKPRPGREGKDRFGVLPRILVTPTIDRVIAYVHGDLDFRTDPVQLRYRELIGVRKARQATEDEL
jgi:hypothetical protein